jgi:hypothetical protein
MAAVEIVKALANALAVHPNGIASELVVLNHYSW